MQERSTGDIAPRPTRNAQGAYFFMSLSTGRRLNQQSFTPLPIKQDVINGVRLLEHHNLRGLDIRDRDRRLFLVDEEGFRYDPDDSTYVPSDEE